MNTSGFLFSFHEIAKELKKCPTGGYGSDQMSTTNVDGGCGVASGRSGGPWD